MTIILRKFNINNITYNDLIVVLGMFNSGKSILIKDILYNLYNIPSGIVISANTNKINNTYNYIPQIFIHNKYDRHIIKHYLKRQEMILESYENDKNSFIILENCLYEYKYNKDKYFQYLIQSMTTLNYLCLIEMHHLPYINDTMINNINYVFILRDVQDINRRRIYEQFKKHLQIEYSVFNSLLNDYTDNYNILVLDLKSKSEYLEDKLFWYKATIHNNFRICNEDSWIYNKNNYINEPPKRELNRHIFY